jgi:hypothetical protein
MIRSRTGQNYLFAECSFPACKVRHVINSESKLHADLIVNIRFLPFYE